MSSQLHPGTVLGFTVDERFALMSEGSSLSAARISFVALWLSAGGDSPLSERPSTQWAQASCGFDLTARLM